MCLNEIFNFLKQRDAPRGETVAFSSNGSHFQSGINFLCAGTIALIFINYNVQLVLSQVPLGSVINRTEIFCSVAPISVALYL